MRAVFDRLTHSYRKHPLGFILLVALLVRLLSVVFSRGYGMMDDHFLVIEMAHFLALGREVDFWSPRSGGNSKRCLLYPALNYVLLQGLDGAGVSNPQGKMLVIRLLHALYSLLVVSIGYRFTLRLAGKVRAAQVGWVLALLWFMPFMSVRNLIEVVSMPLLFAGTWIAWRERDRGWPTAWKVVAAGALFALAFDVRYQTAFFTLGFCLVLLVQGAWRPVLLMMAGMAVVWGLVHGVLEYMVFDYPLFRKPLNYLYYNILHSSSYLQQPWYNFALLLVGVFVPPFSFLLLAGFAASWRKYTLLFVPVLLFVGLHSIFQNKQERFMLPIVPLLVMLGVVGWDYLLTLRPFFARFEKGIWRGFWVLNLVLLPLVTVHYSKRAQVESMNFVRQHIPEEAIVVENSTRSSPMSMPEFYAGRNVTVYDVAQSMPLHLLRERLAPLPRTDWPRWAFFVSNEHLDERVAGMEEFMPGLQPVAVIEPSLLDRLLHWLNPRNKNEAIHVYRAEPGHG